MARKRKPTRKLKRMMKSYWITLFIGVTFSFFVWLTWSRLQAYFGDSNTVWAITGGIVLVAILIGHYSFKRVANKFT